MRETWLRPNLRAILFGSVPPLVSIALGAWLLSHIGSNGATWRWLGAALVVVGVLILALLLRHLRRPRVAYENGHVLFYLCPGTPIAVPVEVVEAFFLGQGPTELPGRAGRHSTVNLVARLSQRHPEWASRPVKPALGRWCDGYVTIRGTWCEPLGGEVIRRLNRRLKDVQTQQASQTVKT